MPFYKNQYYAKQPQPEWLRFSFLIKTTKWLLEAHDDTTLRKVCLGCWARFSPQLRKVAFKRHSFKRRSNPSAALRTSMSACGKSAAQRPSPSRIAMDSAAASNISMSLKPLPKHALAPERDFTISSLHFAAPSRGKVWTVSPSGSHCARTVP